MSTPNPYLPPQAVIRDAPRKPGSIVKAVGLGLVTDFGGTFVSSALFAIVYTVVIVPSGVASGGDLEQMAKGVEAEFTSTESWTYYVTLLIGLSCSVLGGYVCARIARRNELILGAVLAAIVNGLGIVSGPGNLTWMLFLTLIAAGIGSVMAGAWLGQARNRQIAG